jgi:hypothetical protein
MVFALIRTDHLRSTSRSAGSRDLAIISSKRSGT